MHLIVLAALLVINHLVQEPVVTVRFPSLGAVECRG
jgi:hypothetical protein